MLLIDFCVVIVHGLAFASVGNGKDLYFWSTDEMVIDRGGVDLFRMLFHQAYSLGVQAGVGQMQVDGSGLASAVGSFVSGFAYVRQ